MKLASALSVLLLVPPPGVLIAEKFGFDEPDTVTAISNDPREDSSIRSPFDSDITRDPAPFVVTLFIYEGSARSVKKSLEEIARLQRGRVRVTEIFVLPRKNIPAVNMEGHAAVAGLSTNQIQRIYEKLIKGHAADGATDGLSGRKLPHEDKVKQLLKGTSVNAKSKEIELLGFSPTTSISLKEAMKKYELSKLPAWVVSTDERDYVYQGRDDIRSFINDDGLFGRAESHQKSRNRRMRPSVRTFSGGDDIATILDADAGAYNQVRYKGISFDVDTIANRKRFIGYRGKTEAMHDEPNPTIAFNLPRCHNPNVRRNRTPSATIGIENIDFVVYDGDSTEDRSKADRFAGRSVAYPNGKSLSVVDVNNNVDLAFISGADIRCLPTRYRYVREDGSVYREFIEGPEAWDE